MKDIAFKDILLLLCNILFTVTGQLLLKQGMLRVGRVGDLDQAIPKLIAAFTNPFVIGGIAMYGFTTIIWLVILSRVKLSAAYPMISLGYVISISFKESVPKVRVMGQL